MAGVDEINAVIVMSKAVREAHPELLSGLQDSLKGKVIRIIAKYFRIYVRVNDFNILKKNIEDFVKNFDPNLKVQYRERDNIILIMKQTA